MLRKLLSLAVVLALSTGAHASLQTYSFNPGPSAGALGMSGPGLFSFDDAAVAGSPTFNVYTLTSGFSAVIGPTTYQAEKAFVQASQVSLQLNPVGGGSTFLEIVFSGTFPLAPAPFPETYSPELVGLNGSAANFNYHLSNGAINENAIGASIQAAAVPEPSAFAFGGLVAGVVGVGRYFRRRQTTEVVAA